MRISDWGSDGALPISRDERQVVRRADLALGVQAVRVDRAGVVGVQAARLLVHQRGGGLLAAGGGGEDLRGVVPADHPDRKSRVTGQRVSGTLALGRRRLLKTKHIYPAISNPPS